MLDFEALAEAMIAQSASTGWDTRRMMAEAMRAAVLACADVVDEFGTDPAELAHPCEIAEALRGYAVPKTNEPDSHGAPHAP